MNENTEVTGLLQIQAARGFLLLFNIVGDKHLSPPVSDILFIGLFFISETDILWMNFSEGAMTKDKATNQTTEGWGMSFVWKEDFVLAYVR